MVARRWRCAGGLGLTRSRAWPWRSTARSCRERAGRRSRSPRMPASRCSPRCREDEARARSERDDEGPRRSRLAGELGGSAAGRRSSAASAAREDTLTIAGRTLRSRLLLGTGGFPSLELMAEAIAASGSELVTVALRRVESRRQGLADRRARRRGRGAAAEHRRLPHRARRGAHGQARPRGVRHRLDQAGGDRRRGHAAARRARAAARRRGARRRGLRRAPLHDRRPGARAPPGRRRLLRR